MSEKTWKVEKLPNESIVVSTLFENYKIPEDVSRSSADSTAIFNQVNDPVFFIADMRAIHLNVDDITQGANLASGNDSGSYRHPKVREVIFVTADKIVQLAAKGLSSATFGNVQTHTFDTMEEALAYARENA